MQELYYQGKNDRLSYDNVITMSLRTLSFFNNIQLSNDITIKGYRKFIQINIRYPHNSILIYEHKDLWFSATLYSEMETFTIDGYEGMVEFIDYLFKRYDL